VAASLNLLTHDLNKDTNVAQVRFMQSSQFRCAVANDPDQRPQFSKPQVPQPTAMREVDSQDLMQGNREIVIRHGTEAYRLSVTRSGKLILRK
jgi:hemin uptake protein HemP